MSSSSVSCLRRIGGCRRNPNRLNLLDRPASARHRHRVTKYSLQKYAATSSSVDSGSPALSTAYALMNSGVSSSGCQISLPSLSDPELLARYESRGCSSSSYCSSWLPSCPWRGSQSSYASSPFRQSPLPVIPYHCDPYPAFINALVMSCVPGSTRYM